MVKCMYELKLIITLKTTMEFFTITLVKTNFHILISLVEVNFTFAKNYNNLSKAIEQLFFI